jgi:hypothetical protein
MTNGNVLDPKNIGPGQEQHAEFYSKIKKRKMVQYDYRSQSGTLFSCVGKTLEGCRRQKDEWLKLMEIQEMQAEMLHEVTIKNNNDSNE